MTNARLTPTPKSPSMIVGLWQVSAGHQVASRSVPEVLDDLVEVVDRGCLTFDCADIYTGVEDLLGELRRRVLETRGEEILRRLRIHTKLVPDRDQLTSLTKRDVEGIVDRSLRRLGMDELDLVQFAWWNYDVPRWVEVGLWLEEFRAAGKIREIGATNFHTPALQELTEAGVKLAAHQIQYSLLDRRPEQAMADFCLAHGIQLLCYGSLAGGLLSDAWLGKPAPEEPYKNRSLRKYRLVVEECGGWERHQELLRRLDSIGRPKGLSIAQVATRWVVSRPAVGAVVVGFTSPDRLSEVSGGLEAALADEELGILDAWAEEGPTMPGRCWDLERDKEGPHGRIMKYSLNKEGS